MKTLQVPAVIYDEALLFCNARRAEKNLPPITELPPGRAHSLSSCPCAKSTPGLYVSVNLWQFDGNKPGWQLGSPANFITYFDSHIKDSLQDVLPVRDENA